MTELNKRENISEELSRSQRTLAEANLLFDNSYLHGAVSRLMKYREEADYNPSYSFAPEDFLSMRQEAEAFAGEVKEHLRREGYL